MQAEVPDDFGGAPTVVELCPDGPSVPVTADNREQYVQAYTHHLLVSSVSRQYDAFARGFRKVCPAPVSRTLYQLVSMCGEQYAAKTASLREFARLHSACPTALQRSIYEGVLPQGAVAGHCWQP